MNRREILTLYSSFYRISLILRQYSVSCSSYCVKKTNYYYYYSRCSFSYCFCVLFFLLLPFVCSFRFYDGGRIELNQWCSSAFYIVLVSVLPFSTLSYLEIFLLLLCSGIYRLLFSFFFLALSHHWFIRHWVLNVPFQLGALLLYEVTIYCDALFDLLLRLICSCLFLLFVWRNLITISSSSALLCK